MNLLPERFGSADAAYRQTSLIVTDLTKTDKLIYLDLIDRPESLSLPLLPDNVAGAFPQAPSTSLTFSAASLKEIADTTLRPELSIISFASSAFVPCSLTMTGTLISPTDL